jgi:hypothetical protein
MGDFFCEGMKINWQDAVLDVIRTACPPWGHMITLEVVRQFPGMVLPHHQSSVVDVDLCV